MTYKVTVIDARKETTRVFSGMESNAKRWLHHAIYCLKCTAMVTKVRNDGTVKLCAQERDRAQMIITGSVFCEECKKAARNRLFG